MMVYMALNMDHSCCLLIPNKYAKTKSLDAAAVPNFFVRATIFSIKEKL